MLVDSAYSPEGGSASNVVSYEPRLNQRGRASSLDAFGAIMELYLKAAGEMKELTPPFRHDFVDLAREFTSDLIAEVNGLLPLLAGSLHLARKGVHLREEPRRSRKRH